MTAWASSFQSSFDSLSSPPSSDVALGYLIDFCLLHNVGCQYSAALAAALTFPSLTNASLPLPSFNDSCVSSQIATADISSPPRISQAPPSGHVDMKDEILQDFTLLPYYMTLSCSRRGIQSLICNTFFDPHIPCNLVSAWVQPIFEVLDPLIAKKDYTVLAMVLGRQRPNIVALWTGAIVTGMSQLYPTYCRNRLFPIEIHSAAWTDATQTFMSLDPRPLLGCDRIYRSDECRLLYLAGEELNSRLPICPWPPFGTTALSDTDICLVLGLRNGGKVRDPGFSSDTTKQSAYATVDDTITLDSPKETALVSETISAAMTQSIFGWLRSYGWPAAEKAIYSHSWIPSEGPDDESDDGPEDDVSDPGKAKYTSDKFERIAAWLEQCGK
ncbi:uncharacterized protein BP5553_06660 [Venustampulla echinocandica]|uniref:Uncharacterized protein n=1 Tax=Venustampulla echinocandica TaxID=2656787 RepID=A0A370TKK1_9HELO|nr:uncharacterized protein BP5553_06660 [Venustampulla echinocandica]RDL36048.1 hypothetical protein BP5553_06660 [Venustampulla echinocandica]